MNRIFVYEYLSGGGTVAEAGASSELLEMGRAMRDAVAADLLDLEDLDVSVATGEPALPAPERARPVTPWAGEAALEFVVRQSSAHDRVWVIAPETDGLLAQFQRHIDPGRWLGCDGPSIALASSKRNTLLRLAQAGITTPLAFEHAPEITRWVVKPDDGAGSVATHVHASLEAARADRAERLRAGGSATIEPRVDGPALSLSLLCGSAGRTELLSINRQNLAIAETGRLSFHSVEPNALPLAGPRGAALAALANQVARTVPGLRGFVGVDLVWHAQRGPVVIEINPRVTCAYVGLSRLLGRNLAAAAIAAQGDGDAAQVDQPRRLHGP